MRALPRAGALALALPLLLLAGCQLGSSSNTAPSANMVALSDIQWCNQPLITFVDGATTTQTTTSDWNTVKGQLGFTPLLPPTFPRGTCLELAGGSIHSPIYGGQFSITYILPTVGPVSFSEAPKHGSVAGGVQCIVSAQDSKANICLGAISSMTVTVASHQSQPALRQLFSALAPSTNWLPAGATTPTPTATTTP